ncbi:MAG: xylulokinase [Paraglaciecola sp.]|jgi:xylulokinase
MTTSAQYILSFDLGTSSFKAAIYDVNGQIVGSAQQPCEVFSPQEGWAEQDPEDWWHKTSVLTKTLLHKMLIRPEQVAGVVFTTQMCGTIAVNDKGDVLTPAIIWLDTRSKKTVRKAVSGLLTIFGYGLKSGLSWLYYCNGAPNLAGRDPFSKMLWLKNERPEIWSSTTLCLDIKDFLLYRCTGQAVTSPDVAHFTWLMDLRRLQWLPKLLKKYGLSETVLPEIAIATDKVADGLTEKAALHLGLNTHTPVFVGLGDITAAALGSGAYKTGEAHLYFGTSNWTAVHISKHKVSPFYGIGSLVSAYPSRPLLIGAQENSGSALQKVSELLGLDESSFEIFDIAKQSPSGSNGVMFMPWLQGERSPVDDATIRGGFLNLTLATSRADLARATLEGLAYNQHWVAQHAFKMGGTKASQKLSVVGGLANNDFFMQILADVFQRTMVRARNPQWAGTAGAFCCAAQGLGWYASLDEACRLFEGGVEFQPISQHSSVHTKRIKKFKQAYKNNHHWYKNLTL